jgi:hypothetical protein
MFFYEQSERAHFNCGRVLILKIVDVLLFFSLATKYLWASEKKTLLNSLSKANPEENLDTRLIEYQTHIDNPVSPPFFFLPDEKEEALKVKTIEKALHLEIQYSIHLGILLPKKVFFDRISYEKFC